jgi:glycosyltransferase involved in cell wall biosynthesis
MNTVLMVAFHYPPCLGSSGLLRTLKFSRYLPDYGWQPIVLTAHPRAYEHTHPGQLADIPPTVAVQRVFAIDAQRHLAVAGRSLRITALPDRWVSWLLGAVPAGLRLIRQHRPAVIWSTYPIATAHLVALILHRRTGLPWVADFRDSMTEEGYPRDRLTRRIYLAIERRTVTHAASLIFTAPSTRSMYLRRHPALDPTRCLVISNGYDEADFAELPVAGPLRPAPHRPLRILHAGLIYPEERDPRPLFRALSRLKRAGRVDAGTLSVELRASGSEDEYAAELAELAIDDIVHLLPALPYSQILRECSAVDALLLLQGPSCNHQIPAKLYEYLRLRKPILALTDPRGDTAAAFAPAGGATIIDLLDEDALYRELPGFLEAVRLYTHPLPDPAEAARHARHIQAGALAAHLGALLGEAGSPRLATFTDRRSTN